MKKRQIYPLHFLLGMTLCVCFACVDTIEIKSNLEERFLVINGKITNQAGPYVVTVRRSGTAQSIEENISGAEVSLISGTGQTASLLEESPGVYVSDSSDIQGKIGESYRVEVVLSNGKVYQSAEEEMQDTLALGELSYKFVREETLNELNNIVLKKRIKVSVENPIPENTENLFYKWEVSGEYEFRETDALSDIFATTGAGPLMFTCFVPEALNFGDLYLLDGRGLGGKEGFKQEIKTIPVSFKFAYNYCVHVNQLSLSEGAYRFWNQVQTLSEREGLFQASAAGEIKGNMKNADDPEEKVLGYFYTAAINAKKIFVSPDSVANPFSPCFLIDPAFVGACDECLVIRGSYRGAPDYWPLE